MYERAYYCAMTDKAAVALGKKRWKGIPKEERAEATAAAAKARWAKTSPAERLEIGRKLAAARAKKKAGPK
jgi:hypothetical protein